MIKISRSKAQKTIECHNHMWYNTIRLGDGRATEFWRMITKVDWPCFRPSGSSSRGWRLGSSGDSTLQYAGYCTDTGTEY